MHPGWIFVTSATIILFLQNYPLYIRSVPTENELKFHYMVHTSLDVVDEKISAMGKALVDQRELYLGLLYPTEDYKVYPCVCQRLQVWGFPAVTGCTVASGSLEKHLIMSLGKEKQCGLLTTGELEQLETN